MAQGSIYRKYVFKKLYFVKQKIVIVERQFYETYPLHLKLVYEKNLLNIFPRKAPQLFSKSFIYLIRHKSETPSEDETHIDGFIVLSIRQVCY